MSMNVLVDTNILIDYLNMREDFFDSSVKLLYLGSIKEFYLWASPSQVSDLFYHLSDRGKKSYARTAKAQIRSLKNIVSICAVGQTEFDRCIDSDWDDLEDAFIYEAARSIRADVIITRNQKDFALSKIPVFDCDEFFEWLKVEHGLDYSFIDAEFNDTP